VVLRGSGRLILPTGLDYEAPMRYRMNVYLPPEILQQVIDLARRKKMSQSAIIGAAITSFLSPDGTERHEAVFMRRLDRLTRQVQRLERNTGVTMEALALFVRFWLTVTPPLPPDAQAAAQVKGQQRYEDFVEALGRGLQKGRSLLNEIPEDIDNPSDHAARTDELAQIPSTPS
jgi:AcrR family transcriptional regulator